MNPYLAQWQSMLAAGIAGIEEKLEVASRPQRATYIKVADGHDPGQPAGRRVTSYRMDRMLRAAFGDDVVDHYTRAAEVEIEEFERVVTDYEGARGL